MLAAPFCREVHFGNMLASRMQSRVPRCLFGTPNPKDTDELLHESLDADRKRFINRWGVDPCTEDKENYQRNFDRSDSRSPRKNKSLPYSRQTYIHDYWRSRKNDGNKKSLVSAMDTSKKQQDAQKLMK
ncbi:uncharacterized protein [Chelonus insularis]|uniref:uncharacterized protein n=1 Tax=Chelonus insularis TaxID=460826 RepID=UPI00158AD3C1|nr:uncharacterized protein LOC118075068 [Chelonus insularis]